jgi:branched-chain amino acid transport system substrate-binding protein
LHNLRKINIFEYSKIMASFFSTSRQIVVLVAFVAFGMTGLFILGSNNRDDISGNSPKSSNIIQKPLKSSSKVAAGVQNSTSASTDWSSWFRFGKDQPIARRFSSGENILVAVDSNPDKLEAIKLFRTSDFENAIIRFNSSLTMNRNDPEAWIYLNNAKARISKNTVKVAVSVPIGGNVNVAKEILRGVAQYQNEVNQGSGIQGKLLEVLVANDDNDPAAARSIAEQLVKDPDILAVIGHQSSDVSMAAAPIYVKGDLVMVSPTSYARNLSSIGKTIFRTTPSSRAIAASLAKQAINSLHFRRIAICIDGKSQASQSFRDDFIGSLYEYGGKLARTDCDFSAPDFNADEVAAKAIQDGADGLLLSPAVEKLGRAIDVIQSSQGKIPLLAGPSMYTFETLQKGSVDANGMIVAVAWDPAEAKGSLYAKNAKALWGGSGSWRTAMAYDAAKVIGTGLQTAQDRKQLQREMISATFSVKGATGLIEFLPTGDRNKPGTLMKIIPGKKSGTGYDFASLKLQPSAIGGAAIPQPVSPASISPPPAGMQP